LAFRHAPSLTVSLNLVEAGLLPSDKVMLSLSSPVLLAPPTSHPASSRISLHQLIPIVMTYVGCQLNKISPVPSSTFTTSRSPYAGGFFGAASQVLHTFLGLRSCVTNSAPSFSPFGANISTLQDSLYVTGCCFAPSSRRDTTLRHSQSPGCTGCLLPGRLTLTRTGLPPASRR
jgi:hypothetical protein